MALPDEKDRANLLIAAKAGKWGHERVANVWRYIVWTLALLAAVVGGMAAFGDLEELVGRSWKLIFGLAAAGLLLAASWAWTTLKPHQHALAAAKYEEIHGDVVASDDATVEGVELFETAWKELHKTAAELSRQELGLSRRLQARYMAKAKKDLLKGLRDAATIKPGELPDATD